MSRARTQRRAQARALGLPARRRGTCTVRLYRHPFKARPPEIIQATSIAEWLCDRAERGPRTNFQVFRGEPSEATEISDDYHALLANDAEYHTVLESPGGAALPVIQVIIAAYSIASIFLASKPDMPANVNRAQESPNNALGARENQVRLLQRVEDIFGTVHSIPAVMMQTYEKWVGGRKVEYGYYCVTRGYADLAKIADGDTLISAIGSSAAWYWPFTSPNSGDAPRGQIGPAIIDPVLTVRRGVEVDGITLKAQNQIQLDVEGRYLLLQPGDVYEGFGFTVPAAATDRVYQYAKRPNFNAVLTAGQTITIDVPDTPQSRAGNLFVSGALRKYSYAVAGSEADPMLFEHIGVGATVTISGLSQPANNGTFVVATKPDARSITVTTGAQIDTTEELGEPATVDAIIPGAPFNGVRTVLEVGDGWLTLTGATFPYQHGDSSVPATPRTDIIANNGLVDWTDWFTQATADRTESWANVAAPQGMNKDNGGRSAAAVTCVLELQQLDVGLNPIGAVISASVTVSGVTAEEIGETLEVATPWTGPTRARMRRITPFDYAFQGTVVDEVKWTDLSSVSPVNRPHFGNKTTIHTVTEATPRATAVRQRQLNCTASRLLPKWTGSGFTGAFDAEGRHVSGTIHQTSFAHEIIAALTLDRRIGNRPATDLDMPQMAGVVDALYAMHPEAPTFNYTFDSADMSFKTQVATVANAVFSLAYRQSGKIKLALDCKQTSSVALFTHRNKKPRSQRITRTFANDASNDGVEFTYQDPDTLQAETIRLPLDGSATNPKPFEIAGIRSFAQAWLRANREYAKLQGQRAKMTDVCTTDARLLLPFARIENVDNTRFKGNDGEVIAQAGLLLRLSQRVDFTTPGPHSIVLRHCDGALQAITVTTAGGMDPDQVLLANLPSQPLKTTHDADGVRTIYSFGNDSRHRAQSWLVGEIGSPKDGYVSIGAINYSDSYYAMDTEPIPPRDSVIN